MKQRLNFMAFVWPFGCLFLKNKLVWTPIYISFIQFYIGKRLITNQKIWKLSQKVTKQIKRMSIIGWGGVYKV